MKKKYKPSVIILCIIAVIALIFAVYTLVWFYYSKIVFSKYIDNVPKYQHTRYTGVDKNGFTY